jgi:hypothetical protein
MASFVLKRLNDVFPSREFDEVLKVLKWPFTSGSTAPSLAANSNVFQTLENLFLLLLQVSEMYPFSCLAES